MRDNKLYMAGVKQVWSADMRPDGSLGEPQVVVDNLPDGGQHAKCTIAFGPDGMLYITVGSTCNACRESNEENASILRAKPDGTGREIFTKGLRNTIGFGWHPQTGDMWGWDHGSDWRGDDQPPEELNRLVAGGNYGWPYCFGVAQADQYLAGNPPGTTKEMYCPRTFVPVRTYQAHSAPIGMTFYTGGRFPQEYTNDAFVVMRGSWNRNPPTGYKVVRVRYQNGQPAAFEDFMSGFLIEGGTQQFGRIAGVIVAGDGSLLVSEDTNGVIYRISYGR